MDIKLLFDPIGNLAGTTRGVHDLYNSVQCHVEKIPSLENIDIAIIGISEESDPSADVIRQKLYGLQKGSQTYRIADLGNLRPGHTRDDTKLRLSQMLESLLDQGILPVIIGGSHDFDYAQYQAYEMSEKLVSFLNIDAKIDLSEGADAVAEENHIHKIFIHEPNYLFNYIHLAHQSYLVSYNALEVLEKLYFNTIRLGKLRDNFEEAEPHIREADLMSFDLSAIQRIYMQAVDQPQVFGLTGEEACRISWYAGSSERLSSVGFYGYLQKKDDQDKSSAYVVAVMIWYFIEGYYSRRDRQEFTTDHYVKYVVSMDDKTPENIVFYKSNQSEKWWMEIPLAKSKSLYGRNHIVPCSYEDYSKAVQGEIPQRWINNFSKLT